MGAWWSRWASSRRPTVRYSPSSRNAVALQTSRSDSAAWMTRTTASGQPRALSSRSRAPACSGGPGRLGRVPRRRRAVRSCPAQGASRAACPTGSSSPAGCLGLAEPGPGGGAADPDELAGALPRGVLAAEASAAETSGAGASAAEASGARACAARACAPKASAARASALAAPAAKDPAAGDPAAGDPALGGPVAGDCVAGNPVGRDLVRAISARGSRGRAGLRRPAGPERWRPREDRASSPLPPPPAAVPSEQVYEGSAYRDLA